MREHDGGSVYTWGKLGCDTNGVLDMGEKEGWQWGYGEGVWYWVCGIGCVAWGVCHWVRGIPAIWVYSADVGGRKLSPSHLDVEEKTTARAGMLRPSANVSVANRKRTYP